MELFTIEEVRSLLKEECEYHGGINAFGRLSKISGGHVSRVLRGEKEPGPKILKRLRFKAVTRYEPI